MKINFVLGRPPADGRYLAIVELPKKQKFDVINVFGDTANSEIGRLGYQLDDEFDCPVVAYAPCPDEEEIVAGLRTAKSRGKVDEMQKYRKDKWCLWPFVVPPTGAVMRIEVIGYRAGIQQVFTRTCARFDGRVWKHGPNLGYTLSLQAGDQVRFKPWEDD